MLTDLENLDEHRGERVGGDRLALASRAAHMPPLRCWLGCSGCNAYVVHSKHLWARLECLILREGWLRQQTDMQRAMHQQTNTSRLCPVTVWAGVTHLLTY